MKIYLSITLLTFTLSFIEAFYIPLRSRIHPSILRTARNGECFPDGNYGGKYSGEVSWTITGRTCVPWNSIKFPEKHPAPSLQQCPHNYCRNPDNQIQPWCVVKKRQRFQKEYCTVQSQTKPTKRPPTTTPKPVHDTESTCGERSNDSIKKIIGGLRSTVRSQPWIAAIFKGQSFICGGTLIAPCWVLTAAHCFPAGNNTSLKRYSVVLGKNAINETNPGHEQQFSVSKLVVHEAFDYTTQNFNNDIALLKIEDKSGQCAKKSDSVRTACIPPSKQMLPAGFYCEIAGYGRHERGVFEYSRYLKQAQVKLISQSSCQQKYYSQDEVSENMFCAAGREWQEDACQGDSGGPLVCEINNTMFLFGIISWGRDCAERNSPGVYTRVTNYNQWISLHTASPTFSTGFRFPQKDK